MIFPSSLVVLGLSGHTDGGGGAGTVELHNLSLIRINSSDHYKLTDKLMQDWDQVQQQEVSQGELNRVVKMKTPF